MNSLNAYTKSQQLEDEFNQIVDELKGDLEGRRLALAHLASSHAYTKGEVSPWAYTPKIFDQKTVEHFEQIVQMSSFIIEKITERYLKDAEYRKLFGIEAELEELCLLESGYRLNVPIARVDIFYNQQTGDFYFCEINTDGSAGMTNTSEITGAITKGQAYQEFKKRHPKLKTFSIRENCIQSLLDAYAEWRGSNPGSSCADHPTIGIVDYEQSVSKHEIEDFIQIFEQMGISARFVDLPELHIENDRLCDGLGALDLVWRRVVPSDLLRYPCDAIAALSRAIKDRLVCCVGGFRTWPVATKAVFAVMHMPQTMEFLSKEEQEFIVRHVPYTKVLDSNDDLSSFADRQKWIIKPVGGYGGEGVLAGLDCSQEEWEARLRDMAGHGGVVQAYAPQYTSRAYLEDSTSSVEVINMEGLYIFSGKLGGVFTRCGCSNTIGPDEGRWTMGCFVVEED